MIARRLVPALALSSLCVGAYYGVLSDGTNASSAARYSNCVFTNNGAYGVGRFHAGTLETRGNNTLTGNTFGPAANTIGSFSPM